MSLQVTDIEFLIEAFVIFFVVIDPIGLAPIFNLLSHGEERSEKNRIVLHAVIIANIVLLSFAFIGDFLLSALHISDPAFRIAGGLLLLVLAVDMVIVRHSGISTATPAERSEARHRSDLSVFPLAIPLIAGPGGLTTVVLLMRKIEHNYVLQAGLLLVLCFVLFLTYISLRYAEKISGVIGLTGSNVVSRVLGILLVALSIQLIIDGIKLAFL